MCTPITLLKMELEHSQLHFLLLEGLIGEDSFRMLSRKFLRHEAKASFDWAGLWHYFTHVY